MKAAKDGANIVIAAKTSRAHPKLPGTIYTAAKEGEIIQTHLKLPRTMYTTATEGDNTDTVKASMNNLHCCKRS